MKQIPQSLEVSMEALSPVLAEVLSSGGSVELTATGNSMRPMLLHRVSKVRLAPPRSLERGDVPLYRRDSGAYVLHRVISREGETYTLCGDAQWRPEPGIRQDQILAVMTHFCRRGRWSSCSSVHHRLYWKLWLTIRPLRRLVGGGIRRIAGFVGKRTKKPL